MTQIDKTFPVTSGEDAGATDDVTRHKQGHVCWVGLSLAINCSDIIIQNCLEMLTKHTSCGYGMASYQLFIWTFYTLWKWRPHCISVVVKYNNNNCTIYTEYRSPVSYSYIFLYIHSMNLLY